MPDIDQEAPRHCEPAGSSDDDMSTRCLILTAAGAAIATAWVAILSGLLVAHLAGEASSRVVLAVALLAALSVASVLVGVAMLVGAAVGQLRQAVERVDPETQAAIHHIGERLALVTPRHDHRA